MLITKYRDSPFSTLTALLLAVMIGCCWLVQRHLYRTILIESDLIRKTLRPHPPSVYLTVVSDELDAHKKQHDVKFILPPHLQASNDMWVAMTDLAYTPSWINVPQDSVFCLSCWDGEGKERHEDGFFPAGSYDAKSLLTTLNNITHRLFDRLHNSTHKDLIPPIFRNEKNRLKISDGINPKERCYPVVGSSLVTLLGLSKLEPSRQDQGGKIDSAYHIMSKHNLYTSEINLSGGIDVIRVTTDIIKHNRHLDDRLMEEVYLSRFRSSSNLTHIHISELRYHKLDLANSTSFSIGITDREGDAIPFRGGKVYITLNFRYGAILP